MKNSKGELFVKTIILAGGVGSRLWPLSRTYFPKQFVKMKGMEHSMFQRTYQRALLLGEPNDIYIVTNKDYQFLISGQIKELGIEADEKNQRKVVFKINVALGQEVMSAVKIPAHQSAMKELPKGRLLFYVRFSPSAAQMNALSL